MKYKKIMLILITAIFLVGIAAASASNANETIVDGDDTGQMKLSSNNEITEDNLQTSEDNTILTQTDNDETVSAETDSQTLSEGEGTYLNLKKEIGNGGNISLTKSYYRYADSDTIRITTSGVINGNGAVIDMAGSNINAFYVTASDVTIKNLTIKNCHYGNGAAIYFSGSGSVINCNFINNKAEFPGGAIEFGGNGNVENCNFTNNTAGNGGGAILFSGTGNVTNCIFTDNSAVDGGGAIDFESSAIVENCNFTNNTASRLGGAILFSDTGNVTNCIFTDNSAVAGGGAISGNNRGVIADTCIFKTDSDTTQGTDIHPPTLNVDNFTTSYGSGEKLTFDLKTNSGRPVYDGNISISVYYKNNDSWFGNYSCLSGEGWTVDLPAGSYYAVFNTEYAGFKPVNRTVTVSKSKTQLAATAVTATYNVKKNLVITLRDASGNALGGVKFTVKIKSVKTYITDNKGHIKINVAGLVPKSYTAEISFAGNAKYTASSANVKVTVKKATPKITAKKKSKAKKYTITLKDNTGKPMKKARMTLKIKGKTYKATTNAKGKATFNLKRLTKKGTFKATVTFRGDAYYKKAVKKVNIQVK